MSTVIRFGKHRGPSATLSAMGLRCWPALLLAPACGPDAIHRTDRTVHQLIQQRQIDALGQTSDAKIARESGAAIRSESMYSLTPRPIDSALPPAFVPTVGAASENPAGVSNQPATNPDGAAPQGKQQEIATATDSASAKTMDRPAGATSAAAADRLGSGGEGKGAMDQGVQAPVEIPESIFAGDDLAAITTFRLGDALGFAMRHATEVQDAKEELYIAALDLTLERHLWTPLFVQTIQTEYANYGQVRDFDRAMSAVNEFAVSQRLPYGGQVTARVINTLMRDLEKRITSGESGDVILEAQIPLFRGAGKVAYESRFTAERELIYAVRDFEAFRRSFSVRIAADYFQLQQLRATIGNAHKSYLSRRDDWRRADFVNRMGQSRTVFDVTRALSSYRSAEAALVSAKEQFESALDQFKIRIGMSVLQPLDVVDQQDDAERSAFASLPVDVPMSVAVDVALVQRLDLVNSADRVDDAKRSVVVSKNRILPDLNLNGSVGLETDPDHQNSTSYNTERTTWRASAEMRLDDRKAERNAWRASLVALRRAQRDHQRFTDSVRADVRRAVRRSAQQRKLLEIQAMNVDENVARLSAARAQYSLGRTDIKDVVDADQDLLNARNRHAAALADYRNALLEFRRDTGALRVDDEGRWF